MSRNCRYATETRQAPRVAGPGRRYPQAPGLSLQNDSNLSAGLPCGGGVSFWGVSVGVVSVGGVAPPPVDGGVVSVVGVVSVSGAGCVSVSGIVSSGGFAGRSAAGSSSEPQPAAVTARPSSASVARRRISALRPVGAGRSGGSR